MGLGRQESLVESMKGFRFMGDGVICGSIFKDQNKSNNIQAMAHVSYLIDYRQCGIIRWCGHVLPCGGHVLPCGISRIVHVISSGVSDGRVDESFSLLYQCFEAPPLRSLPDPQRRRVSQEIR